MYRDRSADGEPLDAGRARERGATTLPPLGESRNADLQFCLRVTSGEPGGTIYLIGASPLTIGASPSNLLCLSDRRVSRAHCEVFTRGELCIVRDLGSTNGTYLDGVMIVEAVVSPGAKLRIGNTELSIERHADVGASAAGPREQFGEMVGRSAASAQLFAALEQIAKSPMTCLLLGETGTGKELAARALHAHSARAVKPFLVVDCTAVGPQFIEDKLFGHERGAFTGATAPRPGVFEQAEGGSVFLDEIGEMPVELQSKLLGVLERREATRIGSHTPVRLDVRVIAATHRDLSMMVQYGVFRQDLLYRLSEFTVRLPALRERKEDIGLIAEAVLEREGFGARRLTEDAIAYLQSLNWFGNIRELRNLLRRAATLARGGAIDRDLIERLEEGTGEFQMLPEGLVRFPRQASLPPGHRTSEVDSQWADMLRARESGAVAGERLGPHSRVPPGPGERAPAPPAVPPPAAPETAALALPLEQATDAFRMAYAQELRRRYGSDLQRAAEHSGLHPKSVSRLFRMYGVR